MPSICRPRPLTRPADGSTRKVGTHNNHTGNTHLIGLPSGGPPVGARSYGYAVFLMTDTALNDLNRSEGWEFGVGPIVVLVDDAHALPDTALHGDAYAFIYGQQGLMAGIGIEGVKVSKIRKS